MSAKKTPGSANSATKPSGRMSAGKEKPAPSTMSDRESNRERRDRKSGIHGDVRKQTQTDSSTIGENHPEKKSGITGEFATDSTTIHQQPTPPAETHFRAVELAARLACAQMTAEASSESARLTVSGIQKIAAAFIMASARISADLETLRSNPDLWDAGFVDRACSDLLRASEAQELPPHKATPLNHHDHDALFEGAMTRALRLLRSPSEDTSEIHAEQLFKADEILSEAQVGERFKACIWPTLKNRDDFYGMIVRVERWFYDHLGRLHFPEEDDRFTEDAEMMGYVLKLGERRQENDLFRRILDLVRDHEPPNRPRESWSNTEELFHTIWTQHLIQVIFCERRPSESRQEQGRIVRRYRPWGLFRFLRIHGPDDSAGVELLKALVAPRNQLKADAIIHPICQNSMNSDFGPLNRLVDARKLKEMRKS